MIKKIFSLLKQLFKLQGGTYNRKNKDEVHILYIGVIDNSTGLISSQNTEIYIPYINVEDYREHLLYGYFNNLRAIQCAYNINFTFYIPLLLYLKLILPIGSSKIKQYVLEELFSLSMYNYVKVKPIYIFNFKVWQKRKELKREIERLL